MAEKQLLPDDDSQSLHDPPLLRSNVPSDLEALDNLNYYRGYRFLPTSETCRPLPDVRAHKDAVTADICQNWASLTDFTLFSIFCRDFDLIDGKFTVMNKVLRPEEKIFVPNPYPYNIDEGEHWVMWYGSQTAPYASEQITQDIHNVIAAMVTSTKETFDFAWYENPKMSVPDIYHVQVFWVRRYGK